MNQSVGIDIILNERISKILKKYEYKFLNKIYTQAEIDYCMNKKEPVVHLSSRFCVKEAFVKAICTNEVMDFRNIEVYGLQFGKKQINLYNKAERLFRSAGFRHISFSMSHENLYSVAMVYLS